jgi:hypothetical protein
MVRAPKYAGLAVTTVVLAAGLSTAGGAAAKSTLRASMNGTSEVPKGDTDGRGTARITTDSAKGRVCYSIKLSKVGTVAMGHIHKGAKGKAGPVSILLFDKPTKKPKGCVTAKKSLVKDVEEHPTRYYVNVHNAKYPAGAVRGQLKG